MTRRQKDPLRPLTDEECAWLDRISRASSEPASHVARAKALLAVAAGQTYTAAAQAAGRRSGDAVAQLVARFNREGINALVPGHGRDNPSPIPSPNRSASWPKLGGCLKGKLTVPPPGHW